MCRRPAVDDYQTVRAGATPSTIDWADTGVQVIGAESTQTLVFVRDNIILVAKQDETKIVDETNAYTVCKAEFGAGAEVMVTRISPARHFESFRLSFTVVSQPRRSRPFFRR